MPSKDSTPVPIKPWRSSSKRRRVDSNDAIEMEILQQLKQTIPSTDDADDDFVFGRSIALSLKKLQPQQKSLTKIKIQQLLHEAEFQPPPVYPTPNFFGAYNYEPSFSITASNDKN